MSDYFLIVTRLTDRRPAVTGLEFSHQLRGCSELGATTGYRPDSQ